MLTNKKIALTAAFICVLAIFIAIVWWLWPQPHAELLHGEVEVREIRLASKVAGRVSALYVQEGDKVQVAQLLFELASPELNAKLAQAEAAEAAAKAQQDEAEAKAKASADQASAAEARFTMASVGARDEQLRAVQAQSRRAAAAVAEVEAYRQEIFMRSPINAEVADIVIQVGELAPTGYPVITLANPNDMWVTFTIREDKLNAMVPGTEFSAFVPALNKSLAFRVSKLNALPAFANWKQVRGTPGYDLKTFQLEALPVQPEPLLRAGMTVILAMP